LVILWFNRCYSLYCWHMNIINVADFIPHDWTWVSFPGKSCVKMMLSV
jgi:hypothetical protein